MWSGFTEGARSRAIPILYRKETLLNQSRELHGLPSGVNDLLTKKGGSHLRGYPVFSTTVDKESTMKNILTGVLALALSTTAAYATPGTRNSPTGGALPAATTEVGGIVLDLKGTNGTRVVSQLAASSLYVGFANADPLLIGTQTGFTPAVIAALGGGLQSASVRVTLFDGDSQAGDFDFNDNTFFAGGVSFGNWSTVATQQTSNDGLTLLSSGSGFGDNILSTGFFTLNNAGGLSSLFTALGSGSLAYSLSDVDPFDNFYDFTQGVDGGLINVGTGPIVNPGVPEPATWAMLIAGFGLVGGAMRRRQSVRVTYA